MPPLADTLVSHNATGVGLSFICFGKSDHTAFALFFSFSLKTLEFPVLFLFFHLMSLYFHTFISVFPEALLVTISNPTD